MVPVTGSSSWQAPDSSRTPRRATLWWKGRLLRLPRGRCSAWETTISQSAWTTSPCSPLWVTRSWTRWTTQGCCPSNRNTVHLLTRWSIYPVKNIWDQTLHSATLEARAIRRICSSATMAATPQVFRWTTVSRMLLWLAILLPLWRWSVILTTKLIRWVWGVGDLNEDGDHDAAHIHKEETQEIVRAIKADFQRKGRNVPSN